MVVGLRFHMTALVYIERVIALAAGHFRRLKACAKLQSAHARNTEHQLCNRVFETLKNRGADTGRHIHRVAGNRTAQCFAARHCILNVSEHFLSLRGIVDRESAVTDRQKFLFGDIGLREGLVLDVMYRGNLCADINAAALQHLLADCARKAKRNGHALREMTAAADIGKAAVPHGTGIIRRTGTRKMRQILIIQRLDSARIVQKCTERRTGGTVVNQTGKHLRKIKLFVLMIGVIRQKQGAGAASHKTSKIIKIDVFSGRNIIENHTDCGALRLSEQRQTDAMIPN